MPLRFADRTQDTTTTTGTGTITITGTAPTGYQAFATAFATGDQFYYAISDTTNGAWETGIGSLASSTTISRDVVLNSSNSNALVSFAAGTKTVFCDMPAVIVQTPGTDLALARGYALT